MFKAKIRKAAKDHGNMVPMYKPSKSPGILKAMTTPPLRRGDATIVPATQPDTRQK